MPTGTREELDELLSQAAQAIDDALNRRKPPSKDPKVLALLDAANVLRRRLDAPKRGRERPAIKKR